MTLCFRPQFKCCFSLGIEIKERIASENIYVECVKIIVRVNDAFLPWVDAVIDPCERCLFHSKS